MDWEEIYDQAHARVRFEAVHGVCVWERRDGMGRDGHFLAITTATTTTVLLQISTETVQKDSSDILSKKKKRLWTFWLSLVKCERCMHFFGYFSSLVYVRGWMLSRRH